MVKEMFKIEKSIDSRASVALYVYFISYLLYLFFFRVYNDLDIALLFKPIIIPSVAFAYFFITKAKRIYLNLCLFLIIFFADNLILLDERNIKIFSTYLYLIAIGILFNYVITDSKLFKRNLFLRNNFNYFIIGYLSLVIIYKIVSVVLDFEFKEFFCSNWIYCNVFNGFVVKYLQCVKV